MKKYFLVKNSKNIDKSFLLTIFAYMGDQKIICIHTNTQYCHMEEIRNEVNAIALRVVEMVTIQLVIIYIKK